MDMGGVVFAKHTLTNECAMLIAISGGYAEVARASGQHKSWPFTLTLVGELPDDPGTDWSRALETRKKRLSEIDDRSWMPSIRQLLASNGISRDIEPGDKDTDQRDITISSLLCDLDMERQRTNRLGDECGALKSERDDLLRENATLRRKLERRR